MLEQGQKLPEIEFTTEDGKRIYPEDLSGQKTVLYFYPKDDTPGCTKEACAFRDTMERFHRESVMVYGVSLDSPESHRDFRQKYGLNFPLLTDEGGRASQAFGVLGENGVARRVSFLLDSEGRVVRSYTEVDPQTHAEEILEEAKTH
jgi:peroxiredoxin Q/BCP